MCLVESQAVLIMLVPPGDFLPLRAIIQAYVVDVGTSERGHSSAQEGFLKTHSLIT